MERIPTGSIDLLGIIVTYGLPISIPLILFFADGVLKYGLTLDFFTVGSDIALSAVTFNMTNIMLGEGYFTANKMAHDIVVWFLAATIVAWILCSVIIARFTRAPGRRDMCDFIVCLITVGKGVLRSQPNSGYWSQ